MKKIKIIFLFFIVIFVVGVIGFIQFISQSLTDTDPIETTVSGKQITAY